MRSVFQVPWWVKLLPSLYFFFIHESWLSSEDTIALTALSAGGCSALKSHRQGTRTMSSPSYFSFNKCALNIHSVSSPFRCWGCGSKRNLYPSGSLYASGWTDESAIQNRLPKVLWRKRWFGEDTGKREGRVGYWLKRKQLLYLVHLTTLKLFSWSSCHLFCPLLLGTCFLLFSIQILTSLLWSDCLCSPPPNSYVENLTLNGAFGRRLGHEAESPPVWD